MFSRYTFALLPAVTAKPAMMHAAKMVPHAAHAQTCGALTGVGWKVKAHRSHRGTLHSGMRGCSPLRRGPGTWRGQGLHTFGPLTN